MEPEQGYTVSTVRRTRRRKDPKEIRNPKAAYDLVRPLVKDADREQFYAVYLNTRNHVLAVELVSVGSVNASIVHPREVFKGAIALSAASLLVAHNHPSGDPAPSEEDLALTRRLREAGELLGIPLLDHVIVGEGAYRSLKEEGQL
jgi:DNA repair protein RadC